MKDAFHRDRQIARFFLVLSGLLLLAELYRWFGAMDLSEPWTITNLVHSLINYTLQNLGIVLAIYVFICMQVAGWMELRYEANYLPAFFITFLITPFIYAPLFLIKRKWSRTLDDH